jgi:diaminopropionate ammonia-lyase
LSRFARPAHIANPAVLRHFPYPPALEPILAAADLEAVRAEITSWPGYAPTPLHDLRAMAEAAGVAAIHYKDEATRFGLASFKALGGAYAVRRLLERLFVERERRPARDAAELARFARSVTVTCATDGNHGRSVAWGARRFGARCRIYIHATVSQGRKRAIEAFGAEVVRTPGNYDDSVRRAAEDAARHGWHVVSDTSYPGYTEVPADVMRGYLLMADEAFAQLAGAPMPTHVLVQGGVGGVAAAVAARSWQILGPDRPRFIVVEPERAACIAASIEAGERRAVAGDLDTLMAGLACGEVSLVAWEVLRLAVHDVLVIDDAAAVTVMRDLARNDPPVVAGESATCGLAGALAALEYPEIAELLGLGPASRLLVFGTEGATDPELYARLVGAEPVGRPAEEIAP